MFKATIESGGILKGLFGLIKSVREEATFVATPDGLGFTGMDDSHVSLVIAEWNKDDFISFECKEEIRFTVRTDEMSKIFDRVKPADAVSIEIDDDTHLNININENLHYKVRRIEDSGGETKIPKVDLTHCFTIPSKEFSSILQDVNVIADYLNIKSGKDTLVFTGAGDSGDCERIIDVKELEEFKAKKDCESTYGIEYLNGIVKYIGPISSVVSVEYAEKKPLLLKIPIGKKSGIQMFLAPRIET